VSFLGVVFTELMSVHWQFILSISAMDVVYTGNVDNKSLIYLGTKALSQPSTGQGNSLRPGDVQPCVALKKLTLSSSLAGT